jgi:mono/diheme cytochrome c family protein
VKSFKKKSFLMMSRRDVRWFLCAAGLALVPGAFMGVVGLAAAKERLQAAAAPDDEERAEQLALGKRTFQENCLMCHADEMTARQRMNTAQWTAEVDKMIGWGAPVPPDQKDGLIAFLSTEFSPPAPLVPPERTRLAAALATIAPEPGDLPAGNPQRGAPLYTSSCANCHGPEGRGADLGTNLVDRPVLFRPTEFVTLVRDGRRRMPGFQKALTDAQAADILAWLRQKHYGR